MINDYIIDKTTKNLNEALKSFSDVRLSDIDDDNQLKKVSEVVFIIKEVINLLDNINS